MRRVRLFLECDINELEKNINLLVEKRGIEIVNVSISTIKAGYSVHYAAAVTYEE